MTLYSLPSEGGPANSYGVQRSALGLRLRVGASTVTCQYYNSYVLTAFIRQNAVTEYGGSLRRESTRLYTATGVLVRLYLME